MAPALSTLVVTTGADSACVYQRWLGHLGYQFAAAGATLWLPAPLDDLAGAVRRPVDPPYA